MIVATAGHVDHGKTSLVKRLTGVDTDRLEEEKRRGLSINLGFAYHRLDDGTSIGFVDVPGHNRFINTMIAGICGIDLGLLVVAADDGPMPQTLEHLEVLRLLGVDELLLVLTKTDRVDQSRVDEVCLQVLELLPKATPVFPVSNIDGEGVAALLDVLDEKARACSARSDAGCFRLSIDRAFHLRGVGLVVTGTALAGRVRTGDSLTLLPAGRPARVRGIHAQDEQVRVGHAGERCALNLTGDIERDAIERGDWLVATSSPFVTRRFDASFALLNSAPFALRHLTPVRLHLGAKRIAARLYLIQAEQRSNRLQPGQSALVQLIVDGDIACCRGDLFLLRDDSESITLGGGKVLDPDAPRAGKARPARLDYLAAMALDSPVDAISNWVIEHRQTLDFSAFRRHWNLRDDESRELLEDARLATAVEPIDVQDRQLLVSAREWLRINDRLLDEVRTWHAEHPGESGIKPALLKSRLKTEIDEALVVAALTPLVRDGSLQLKDGLLLLPGHSPQVTATEQSHWQRVETALQQHGRRIPMLSEVTAQTRLTGKQLDAVLRRAVRDGHLHKVNDRRYALPDMLATLAAEANQLLAEGQPLTVQSYRDRVGCGRRLAVDLLEYFDAIRFTRRREHDRVVIDPDIPAQLFSR